ncbi:MAG: septum formation initiator family protein [Prevotella sp.]|nr:septum formation initiator family protein [Prevotella sp.]
MKKLIALWVVLKSFKPLKYIIVIVIAVLLIGFVDENSVWSHLRNKEHMSELKSEIDQLNKEHEHNKEQIKMLDEDPKAIQKIARERYFMKADDEDIYILKEGEEPASAPQHEAAQ